MSIKFRIHTRAANEAYPKVPEDFTITEKAPTREGRHVSSTYHRVNVSLALCINSFLNVKALVGACNKEKALVGVFSVIVKSSGTFG